MLQSIQGGGGKLVSAFEGHKFCTSQEAVYPARKLYYEVEQIMVGPKLDEGCLGLSILTTLEGAEAFFKACFAGEFALWRVVPKSKVRLESYPYDIFVVGYTDSLKVGKLIDSKVAG